MTTTKPSKPRLRGRKIVKVIWNEFPTGRGNAKSTDPTFILDDGSRLSFSVQETDVGEYGISVNLHKSKGKDAPNG